MDFVNTTSLPHDLTTYKSYSWLEPPLEEHTYIIVETVFKVVVPGVIALFGVCTNIINMIVFSRIGILSDSNTVSLTGLSISDFVCCLYACWGSFCLGMARYDTSLDVDFFSIHKNSFGRPRYVFTQITCWLTAYIAIERFVAIVFPFKVKRIFTAKHTVVAMCCIYVAPFIADYPQYTLYVPKWVPNPENNRTILKYVRSGITFTHQMRMVFNNLFLVFRLLSFTIVIICNVTMLRKLALRKFKNLSASTEIAMTDNNSAIATDNIKKKSKIHKDTKIITMMSMVCTLFIVCNTPDLAKVILFFILFVPLHDQVHNFVTMLCYVLETINSSCNIFIYLSMSSRYRRQFKSWIGLKSAT